MQKFTFVGLAENTNPKLSKTPIPISDCSLLREPTVSKAKNTANAARAIPTNAIFDILFRHIEI